MPLGIGLPPPVPLATCSESEPNEQTSNASPISVPGACSGSVSTGDSSGISINYGSGLSDGIEDLFVLTLPASMKLNIDLSWSTTNADLDLFLLRPNGSSLDVVSGSTTNGSAPESIATGTLAAGTYYIGISAFNGSSNYTLTVSERTASSGCTEDATTACLNNGRFRVRATYDTGSASGNGGAVRLTSDTGYFWFFGNANVEMVVKILDACSFNQRFWVFTGGLTDVGVTLNVTDTQTSTTKTYTNARGTAFKPVQDTDAFATCGGGTPSCSYALSPGSQSFSSGGGAGSVVMSANSGCNWTASSSAGWLIVNNGASGSGNGTINFNVAANGGGARSATISAGGQTATINQSGVTPSCSYNVLPTSANYGSGSSSGTVNVSTSAGCAWTAGSNVSWLTITSGSSGSGSGSVSYSVAANSGSARTGSMTIAGQTVSVSQAGASTGSYDGTWTGSTSQGKTISITVSGNAVTTFTLGWHAAGSCTVDGTTTVTYNTPKALSGNTFTLSASGGGVTINVNGSFSSTSAGSGGLTVSFSQSFPSCSASGSGTFTVSK